MKNQSRGANTFDTSANDGYKNRINLTKASKVILISIYWRIYFFLITQFSLPRLVLAQNFCLDEIISFTKMFILSLYIYFSYLYLVYMCFKMGWHEIYDTGYTQAVKYTHFTLSGFYLILKKKLMTQITRYCDCAEFVFCSLKQTTRKTIRFQIQISTMLKKKISKWSPWLIFMNISHERFPPATITFIIATISFWKYTTILLLYNPSSRKIHRNSSTWEEFFSLLQE